MAKQTYTSGQVLSAAQMTTLQANDYNQTVSAKVASYTLVASDVGTRITMSNAGATTITVNTGLFAAGDTLIITNIGAGACTITAGTATVSTISSLVLAQWDSGTLYFTSTGVAIWQKFAGPAAAAGGMTLIANGSLSGTQTNITSIPGTYQDLVLMVFQYRSQSDNPLQLRINNDTGNNYAVSSSASGTNSSFSSGPIAISGTQDVAGTSDKFFCYIYFPDYASTTVWRRGWVQNISNHQTTPENFNFQNNNIFFNLTDAITQLNIRTGGETFQAGTYEVWGIK